MQNTEAGDIKCELVPILIADQMRKGLEPDKKLVFYRGAPMVISKGYMDLALDWLKGRVLRH